MVRPGRGISVNTNAAALEKFGGARQVMDIPAKLELLSWGKPGHFEVGPRVPMTLQRYQELSNQVKLK